MAVAFQKWSERLAGLTDEQLKRGIDSLPDKYPPTSRQFRKLCIESDDPLHNSGAYKPLPPALPYKKTEQEISEGKKHINELKEILK